MIEDLPPASMAARLVRHHSDIGFIRSYILSHHATAPTREKLAAMRAEHLREVAADKAKVARLASLKKFTCEHPMTNDNIVDRSDGGAACLTCKQARDAAAAKRYRAKNKLVVVAINKPSRAINTAPWPKWYRQNARSTVLDIAAATARINHRDVSVILGDSRTLHDVRIRFATVLVASDCGYGPVEIARALGGRDRSTILHAANRARDMVKRDPDFAAMVVRVRALVSGSAQVAA